MLQALEFEPEDKLCLVARSKCYLRVGNATEALKDAEESLKEDQKYHKVLIYEENLSLYIPATQVYYELLGYMSMYLFI